MTDPKMLIAYFRLEIGIHYDYPPFTSQIYCKLYFLSNVIWEYTTTLAF